MPAEKKRSPTAAKLLSLTGLRSCSASPNCPCDLSKPPRFSRVVAVLLLVGEHHKPQGRASFKSLLQAPLTGVPFDLGQLRSWHFW